MSLPQHKYTWKYVWNVLVYRCNFTLSFKFPIFLFGKGETRQRGKNNIRFFV